MQSIKRLLTLPYIREKVGCFKIRVTIAHVIPAKAGIQRLNNVCYIYIEGLYDELIK
jgi:hypothetical protein